MKCYKFNWVMLWVTFILMFAGAGKASAYIPPVYFVNPPGTSLWGDSVVYCWQRIINAEHVFAVMSPYSDFSSPYLSVTLPYNAVCAQINGLPEDDTPVYVRVKAVSHYFEWTNGETHFYSHSSYPPPRPILFTPDDAILPGSSVELHYSIPEYANDMKVTVATDPYFSNIYVSSGWTGFTHNTAFLGLIGDGRTYYWKVKARNWTGESPDSIVHSFINGTEVPDTPDLISPNGDIASGDVLFQWEDAARAVDYFFEVATDSSFPDSEIVCSGWGNSGQYCYFNSDGQTYYWRVRAQNYNGWSGYSIGSFKAGDQPPEIPVLYNPPESGAVTGPSAGFMWEVSNTGLDYRLQVASDSAFQPPLVHDESLGWNIFHEVNNLKEDGRTYYWRVIASNYNGETFSPIWSFINRPSQPPEKPSIVYPASDGAVVQGTAVSLQWAEAARTREYLLHVDTDPTFPSYPLSVGTDLARTVSLRDDGTTYYLRVQAINSLGSTYSDTRSFINMPSAAPAKPAIIYPATEGAVIPGNSVSLQWAKAARANDYHIQVGTDPSFSAGSLVADQWVGSALSHYLNLRDDGTTYYWRVEARNWLGGTFSDTRSFVNMPSSPPDPPHLNNPGNGSYVEGIYVYLFWEDIRASNYLLQVATDPYFNNLYISEQWVGNVTSYRLNLENDGKTYYWRVAASNAAGTGEFSAPFHFMQTVGDLPDPPLLLSPSNHYVPDDPVLFQWSVSPNADSYLLQIAYDPSFNNVHFDLTYASDRIFLSFPGDGTTYWWRVQAKNQYGSGSFSETRSFVNGPQPFLPPPVLLIPGDGNKVDGTNIILQWGAVDTASYYQLQIATDNYFSESSKIFDRSVDAETNVQILGDEGVTYYWRVATANSDGDLGQFSAPRSFVNGPTAPNVPPALLSPLNGINDGGYSVTFIWSGVSNANDYILQVSPDPAFNSLHFSQWVGNTTAYTVTAFPDSGASYYWRVAARNIAHPSIVTAYQAPATFINGPSLVHAAPPQISPLGVNTAGANITFSWQPVERASSYRIEVAFDDHFTTLLGGAQNVTSTTAYLTGFDNVGHVFYWRVAGVNQYGTGPYSVGSFTNGTLQTNTGTNQGQTLDICSNSTTNAATGSIFHDQTLFSAGGTPLAVSFRLFYNSLPPYKGALGSGWSHSYELSLTENGDGSVLLRNGDGARSFYYRSGSGYASSIGDTSELIKNSDGTYRITFREGRLYNFDQGGKITSIVDRFNNILSLSYTGGDLTTVTDPAGRVATISYDLTTTPHRISSITDPNGKTYDFAYQGNQLWKVTNPVADDGGATRGFWEYEYDAEGYLKARIDPNQNKSQYTYYPDHRMESAIDPEGVSNPVGHTRTFVYPENTDNLKTTTFTEKDGGIWLHTFDTQAGVLKQKTDPNGKVTSFSYYPNGYLKSKTEPKDGVTRLTTFYTYDSYGNLLTQTEPVDLSMYSPPVDPETVADPTTLDILSPPITPAFTYTYDNANYDRLTSISDLRATPALITTFAYSTENGGEVTTATAPGNAVTVTKKYPNGAIREIIDANGGHATYTNYPDTTSNRTAGIVGLLQTATGPDGVTKTITSYDKNGNPTNTQVKDATGSGRLVTVQQFDTLNRLRKVTKTTSTLPDNITEFSYDQTGNLSSLIDPEQHETKYLYNFNGQIIKTTDAKLNDTIFTYSGSGCTSCGSGVNQLTGVYDPNVAKNTPLESQPHTSFSYDGLGRIHYEADPLGKKLRYTYYDNGLLKEKYDATTTPEVLLATYAYNNRGQVTDKIFTDGTAELYTYYPDGKLETAANDSISYSYTYHDDGRLKTVTDTTNSRAISYDQYDGLGQRKQVTILPGTADERVITYDYDDANRPWHITSGGKTFTFGYDSLGRRSTIVYPNQTGTSYGYDDFNRLISIKHQVANGPVITAISYPTYDQMGNRKSKTAMEAETYLYDEIYRLITVTSTKPEAFSHDAAGNRQSGPGAKDTGSNFYQHNDANQMIKGRRLTYGYDNVGNQTTRTLTGITDRTWTQTWDYNNRLIKVEKVKGANKRSVTFKYDPFGRRIEKRMDLTINGATKTTTYSYFYDNDNIVFETMTDGSETTKTFYTHGPGVDEHLALERDTQFHYYHADGLGSTVAISNATGSVVQQYSYDSYGMVKPTTSFANSYTYTGREWDKETGLYYYRARYYDPMEGRFISKDPIGFKGGMNIYNYVQNNPVNRVDPLGLYWFRQPWQTPGVVGRLYTIVPPEGPVSEFIEQDVPAGYTFGEMHDSFVGAATSAGIPDWLVNIPSMIPAYGAALATEVLRTVGILNQPTPTLSAQPTPCK